MVNYLVFLMSGVFFLNLISCAPIVKTDLKSLQENPEAYKGKKLIITTDIKNVVETPDVFVDKKIEVSGYVILDGFRKTDDDWSFV